MQVSRTVLLNAPSEDVWDLVGGFYTIHLWHPDIENTQVTKDQIEVRQLRRYLTFYESTPTIEELTFLDDDGMYYNYKWYEGEWGEEIKNYHSCLRVFAGDENKSCTVQWMGWFDYPTDAISGFYLNGFKSLEDIFN